MKVIERYKTNNDNRFVNFTKQEAYNMMINDYYLTRVVEKNV